MSLAEAVAVSGRFGPIEVRRFRGTRASTTKRWVDLTGTISTPRLLDEAGGSIELADETVALVAPVAR